MVYSDGLEFRAFKDSDRETLIGFLNEDGEIFSNELWEWKYGKKAFKKPFIFLAVNEEGTIIGHAGGMAEKLKIGEKVYLAYKSEDVKIKKEFRRKGIIKQLYESISNSKFENEAIVYGCPTPKMIKINLQKLNLRFGGIIYNFVKLFPGKKKLDGKIEVRKIGKFGKEADELWEDFSKKKHTCIERKKNYLNWRFFEKPEKNYDVFMAYNKGKSVGYIVAEKSMFKITIIDLVTINKQAINALLNNVLDYYNNKLIIYFQGYFSDEELLSELKANGFFKSPFGKAVISFYPFFGGGSVNLNVKNWFITEMDIIL